MAAKDYDDVSRDAQLVVGALRGYRTWTVDPDGYLRSRGVTYQWPGDQIKGECLAVSGLHPRLVGVPFRGCSCGIYALHKPTSDGNYPLQDAVLCGGGEVVGGVVAGSGSVRMGSRGFKASHARIEALSWILVDRLLIDRVTPVSTSPDVSFVEAYAAPLRPVRLSLVMSPVLTRRQDIERFIIDRFRCLDDTLRRRYPRAEVFPRVVDMLDKYPPVPVTRLVA